MHNNIIDQLNDLHKISKHDKIIETIEKLPTAVLNYELKNLLARAYNNISKYDIALEILLSEEKTGKDDDLWNFRVGYAYFYKEEADKALPYFQQSVALGDLSAERFVKDCIHKIENKTNLQQIVPPSSPNLNKMTLNKIAWVFSDNTYNIPDQFNQEVIDYQISIYKSHENWKPNEIVFDFPQLQIQYMAWITQLSDLLENETLIEEDKNTFEAYPDETEHQVEIVATLHADNGKYFTALEFLMKTHNQQANKELGDHIFFEGTDEHPQIIDGLPLCYIACGS